MADTGNQNEGESYGLRLISPEFGLQMLQQLLFSGEIRAGVLGIDTARLEGVALEKVPGLLRDLVPHSATLDRESGLLDRLRAVDPNERPIVLQAYLARQVARVLSLEEPESIDAKKGFFNLGMDSLTSVELRNRLQLALGRTLPATLAMDHPTIYSLAGFLLGRLGLDAETSQTEKPKQEFEEQDIERLKEMSDTDVDAIFRRVLEPQARTS